MKRFKSFLAEQMEDFIIYRFQLGYSNTSMIYCLKMLDRYVSEKQVTLASFDPLFFIRFRADLDLEPRSINMIFRMIKIFFNYLLLVSRNFGWPYIDALLPLMFQFETI